MQSELKDNLLKVLENEKKLYQELYEIAEAKNRALLENDTEALSENLREDQKVIEQIEEKDKKRKKIISDIIKEFDLELEKDNYKSFIQKLPDDWGEELNSLREELIELTDEFYRLNNENQELLTQALEINSFSIESILNSIQNKGSTYSRTAKEKKEQPRLLNKQV